MGLSVFFPVLFRWLLRDRVIHAVLGVALFLVFLIPFFSTFSMRQVQELALTLSLSSISLVLLFLTVLLGGTSIWREVERRYTTSVLSLPVSRAGFVMGKFFGIAVFLVLCAVVLSLVCSIVLHFLVQAYPGERPILWQNYFLAVFADCFKYIMLTAVAVLLSSICTSYFLPLFGTVAVYFAGNASQEVHEYISGDFGNTLSAPLKLILNGVYYILPNLSAFNLKVQAIYGLPHDTSTYLYVPAYGIVYTGILLWLAVWRFSKRELP